MMESDLLFMSLPDRVDGTPGGRISAKTYEYLMTDRPILAALPPGENRDYLQGKPGAILTDPRDVDRMADVIEQLTQAAPNGPSKRYDRSALKSNINSRSRAVEFAELLKTIIEPLK
jgi:hypothetical protein